FMSQGYGRVEAYMRAAQRMAWPVTSSTATTLAAFMPLLFWPGIAGEFMKYLPITLLVTLTGSLIMALVFVPTVGGVLGRDNGRTRPVEVNEADLLLVQNPYEGLGRVRRSYLAVLDRAVRHPGKLPLVGILLRDASIGAYYQFGLGYEFFPSVEPTQAALNIRARGDFSVEERDVLVRQIEDRVMDMPEFESIYTRTSLRFGSEEEEDLIGRIQLRYIDWSDRRPSAALLEVVRQRPADLAGLIIEPEEQESGLTSGKPIQIELSSRQPELLPDAVAQIRNLLTRVDGLVDVTDSRPIPGIEWRLRVDRDQAARFGADITAVGNAIQL